MTKYNKIVILFTLAVMAMLLFFFGYKYQNQIFGLISDYRKSVKQAAPTDYILPEFVFCGNDEEISLGQLSHIRYVEESMCAVSGGESFASETGAKLAYGVKVDLAQVPTEIKTVTTEYSAYPGDTLAAGGQTIKVAGVNANEVQFEVSGTMATIAAGAMEGFTNLDIAVSSGCGITHQAVFSITERECCEEGEEGRVMGAAEEVEEEDEHQETRKAREETEEDLKASGRSGYKGVILPKDVATEYPSTDFALFPFTALPSQLCCGCKQEYKNLVWWGDFLTAQVRIGLINTINELNAEKSEFEEDPFTLAQRDEDGMRFDLREVNYLKQNKEYFTEERRMPKGEWVNPDYVIEGNMRFRCCEGSTLVKAIFTAKLINAKTEKQVEEISFSPAACFDLVRAPRELQAVCTAFGQKAGNVVKERFGRD
jgi:hypothetical protein